MNHITVQRGGWVRLIRLGRWEFRFGWTRSES